MTEFNLEEVIGSVGGYVASFVEEVAPKEMIGDFNGVITDAELKTGTSQAGKPWASVNLRVECTEDGLKGRLAFINTFLGKEPPLYGTDEQKVKTQTENFLDTLQTAGLKFDPANFQGSVTNLVDQTVSFKSWHKKKKNDTTGKYEPMVNDQGYKVLNQRLIAPISGDTNNLAASLGL